MADIAGSGAGTTEDALVVTGLVKRFRRRGHPDVVAADGVSFRVPTGTTLGIVGESGSGKSTVARCLVGLHSADEGSIEVLGHQIVGADSRQLRAWRSDMQIVFQEPQESLDPRMRAAAAIAEPLLLHTQMRGLELSARVDELLGLVGLGGLGDRFPNQLSGGQQQRVNIARALATHPRFIVLDEPTASLDVSVRAEILRLIVGLQHRLGLTYVFISHDLTSVRSVCDSVAVMYRGQIVEQGPVGELLSRPEHPYTQLLLASELSLDPDVRTANPPVAADNHRVTDGTGCIFASRCPRRMDRCEEAQPPMRRVGEGHAAACLLAGDPELRAPVSEMVRG